MLKFSENYGKLWKICIVRELLLLSMLCPCAELSLEVYSTVCTRPFFMVPCDYHNNAPPPRKKGCLCTNLWNLCTYSLEYVGLQWQRRIKVGLRLLIS